MLQNEPSEMCLELYYGKQTKNPNKNKQTKKAFNLLILFSISWYYPACSDYSLYISLCCNLSFRGKSISTLSINLSDDEAHSSVSFHCIALTDTIFLALIDYFFISVYPI